MEQYLPKSALVAEIENRIKINKECMLGLRNLDYYQGKIDALSDTISLLNTLEVKDPYEQDVQYDSVKMGIQAHAETYSFNIESKLFNQLTKEQQELWRKEIEQAAISGGEAGVELTRDKRYKENLEVKEVDLEIEQRMRECPYRQVGCTMYDGKILECRGACSWVVDHLKLKQFKAQKGE